jgi:hypothetical protein
VTRLPSILQCKPRKDHSDDKPDRCECCQPDSKRFPSTNNPRNPPVDACSGVDPRDDHRSGCSRHRVRPRPKGTVRVLAPALRAKGPGGGGPNARLGPSPYRLGRGKSCEKCNTTARPLAKDPIVGALLNSRRCCSARSKAAAEPGMSVAPGLNRLAAARSSTIAESAARPAFESGPKSSCTRASRASASPTTRLTSGSSAQTTDTSASCSAGRRRAPLVAATAWPTPVAKSRAVLD